MLKDGFSLSLHFQEVPHCPSSWLGSFLGIIQHRMFMRVLSVSHMGRCVPQDQDLSGLSRDPQAQAQGWVHSRSSENGSYLGSRPWSPAASPDSGLSGAQKLGRKSSLGWSSPRPLLEGDTAIGCVSHRLPPPSHLHHLGPGSPPPGSPPW